jgi:hypothetical protein
MKLRRPLEVNLNPPVLEWYARLVRSGSGGMVRRSPLNASFVRGQLRVVCCVLCAMTRWMYLFTKLKKINVRGPFANFVDSPYYFESELCGGAVTVSFSKCLPWLTMFHPLFENVLQTVDHFEISCFGVPFSWMEKPRNCMGWNPDWILCSTWKKWICGTPLEHPSYSPDLAPCDFRAFPTTKRELRRKKFRSDRRSAARFREVGGAL